MPHDFGLPTVDFRVVPSAGGAAHPLTYVWNATGLDGSLSIAEEQAIRDAIATAQGSSVATIASALLTGGSALTIELRVTNRVGRTSAAVGAVVRKEASPVLVVSFDGGFTKLSTYRTARLSLAGQILLPTLTCVQGLTLAGLQVAMGWTASSDAPGWSASDSASLMATSAISSFGRQLTVPANLLVAGAVYWFTLTVPDAVATNGITFKGGSATVCVNVTRSPLVVTIEGGDRRAVGASSELRVRLEERGSAVDQQRGK